MNLSPMSSPGFEASLKVDTKARGVLLALHVVACLVGLLIIAAIRLPLLLTLLLGTLWVAVAVARFVRTRAGFQRVAAFALDDTGAISIIDYHNSAEQAFLMPGSRVLPAFAWLRMLAEDGHELTELLFAASQPGREWRRLHILWRLGNTLIGATSRN